MKAARLSLGILLATLSLVVFVLFVRRLGGALVAPLDFVPSLAIGLLIAFGTWTLRRLALLIVPEEPRLLVGIGVVTWLLVIGLTLRGTNPLAILALWLPVIATEALWRAVPLEPGERSGGRGVRRGDIIQQMTRTRGDDGERVGGSVQIAFATGEQTAAEHIAFCPPLMGDPEVQIEDADQHGVTIRATDCRSYGLRLEARRGRDTAEPLTVLVKFEAVSI